MSLAGFPFFAVRDPKSSPLLLTRGAVRIADQPCSTGRPRAPRSQSLADRLRGHGAGVHGSARHHHRKRGTALHRRRPCATSSRPCRGRAGAGRPRQNRAAPWWPGGGPLSTERGETASGCLPKPLGKNHLSTEHAWRVVARASCPWNFRTRAGSPCHTQSTQNRSSYPSPAPKPLGKNSLSTEHARRVVARASCPWKFRTRAGSPCHTVHPELLKLS